MGLYSDVNYCGCDVDLLFAVEVLDWIVVDELRALKLFYFIVLSSTLSILTLRSSANFINISTLQKLADGILIN